MSLRDCVDLSPASGDRSQSPLLVYFIPGNPGHVEYYREFLVQVRDELEAAEQGNIVVYGASHDGFSSDPSSCSNIGHSPPFSLREIVQSTQQKVSAKARQLARPPSTNPIPVVLVGHSVGAYILLEAVSWWQQHRSEQQCFQIIGGIGLFPTVVDIAKSQKGKLLGPLLTIPFLPIIASIAARLLSLVPLWVWDWAKTLTPGEKLASHTAVTEAVIRSPHGAQQTIFMAADEMRDIKEDKWHPVNLWGSHTPPSTTVQVGQDTPKTKLFFYWGQDDYWVDNDVRDTLIAKRAKRSQDNDTANWPEMVIDTHRMDHCFSLHRAHSRIVSRQVADWIARLTSS